MSRGYAAVVVGLLLAAGCSASSPTVPNPPLATVAPRLGGPLRTFVFAQASYPVREYTRNSTFRLYDSGDFALDYSSGSYFGKFTDTNGNLTFEWAAGSSGGVWGATGTLIGDKLNVRYNTVMQLSDFEDAEYVQVR